MFRQSILSLLCVITLTFFQSGAAHAEVKLTALPEIPDAVTSFGAAVNQGSLYIYGGHWGAAHEYFKEDQSNKFYRLSLKEGKEWEELPDGPRLQGLALVSHGDSLYRLGGFSARNDETSPQDLWSSAECARFDTKTKTWQPFPSLPEPRSSFDAAVAGDKIYVIGGWSMQGKEGEKTWHQTAWSIDLSQENLKWTALPQPPFKSRALSVAAHGNKVYAIGGMKVKGGPTRDCYVFDIASQTWNTAPALTAEKNMEGFGNSSFAMGDNLYCSTLHGYLFKLSEDGANWEKAAELPHPRFFHRMVSYGQDALLIVGGSSMETGKVDEVDLIKLTSK